MSKVSKFVSKPEKLTKEQEDKQHKALMRLRASRIAIGDPFYEAIAFGLNISPDWSCKSIGVTPTEIVYNPSFIYGMTAKEEADLVKEVSSSPFGTDKEKQDYIDFIKIFYKKKSDEDMRFIWKHEVEHIIREFFVRAKSLGIDTRKRSDINLFDLLNIAQDHVINLAIMLDMSKHTGKIDLKEAEIKQSESSFLRNITFAKFLHKDVKYIPNTTEEIFEDLLKKEEQNQENKEGSGGSSGEGKSNSFVFDEHFEGTEEEMKQFQDMCFEAVIRAAKQAGASAIRPDVKHTIDNLDKPTIKWQQLLDRDVKSFFMRDYTYAELHNKTRYMTQWCRKQGYISDKQYLMFPTEEPEQKVKVVIGFDTSGSISLEEKKKALSEAVGILKQFKDYELAVFSWGSDVIKESVRFYTPANHKEIASYPFMDGGGTSISPTLDFMGESFKDYQPVIFTDGYFWDKPDVLLKKKMKNLIWVVFDNESFKSEIGRVVLKSTRG